MGTPKVEIRVVVQGGRAYDVAFLDDIQLGGRFDSHLDALAETGKALDWLDTFVDLAGGDHE